jgi:RNA polymerase sigma-70 factor (ECF subfamily)
LSADQSKAKAVDEQEAELVRRVQRGDEAAFSKLYEAHKRRVFSLCLRMARDSALAEDLTQQAFLQLFRKIGSFRGQSAFSTWLHRLVVNVVLMHLRKKGLDVVPLEDSDSQQEDVPRRDYGQQDAYLVGSLDRITLLDAIDKLPSGYRNVFLLHDVEGYEHHEIAGMTGRSVGNSKSQLHKARLKLRELLQQGTKKSAMGRNTR